MKVKTKLLTSEAIVPKYATGDTTCMDIFYKAGVKEKDWKYSSAMEEHSIVIKTGLNFEIPENHEMLIFSRYEHGVKHSCVLANGTGVIDSDYRGEVQVKLVSALPFEIKPEGVITQFLIVPIPKVRTNTTETSRSTDE